MKTQARAPRSAAGRVSMAVLLGFGPFFAYPWKPLVNYLAGIPYAKAYRNFREQHTDSANLALHVVCLASQLAGNFGLLCALDLAVFPHLPPAFATGHAESPLGLRVFSLLTVAVWLITLLLTAGAPWAARLVSAACIACAYFASPLLHPVQVELGSYALFLLAALAYSCTAISPAKCAALAAGLAVWFGAFELLCAWSGADGGEQTLGFAPHWRQASTNGPIFGEYAAQTAGAFGGLLAVAALSPRPLAPTVALGFAGSRLAYVLTGESLFWWFTDPSLTRSSIDNLKMITNESCVAARTARTISMGSAIRASNAPPHRSVRAFVRSTRNWLIR